MKFTRTGVLSLLRVPPGSILAEIETEDFDDDPSINGREVLRFASEHAPALCAYVGKPCRLVLEFDEAEVPPAVNPLDEGWRKLTLALASYGFEPMPFDGQQRHAFRLSKVNTDAPTTFFTVYPTDDDALSFLDIGFHAVNDLLGKAVVS